MMKETKLMPFDRDGNLSVIVDTPRGSRNKYEYDPDLGIFKLGGVLTAGHSFPFDFGSIPGTLGGDGDALDVLILAEEATFPGCLVPCRLIGGIKGEQTEKDGKTVRNDRLLAVPTKSPGYENVLELSDLADSVVDQIEHFFVSYNEVKGKTFDPAGRFTAAEAVEVVKEGVRRSTSS